MVQISVTKDFIESTEEGFAEKKENFIQIAPKYVEDGILPAVETEALIAKLNADEESRKQKNTAKKLAHDSRLSHVAGHKVMEKDLREYRKLIDSIPEVTPEIKQKLGLVNEKRTESTTNKKPNLKARAVGGVPHITFKKFPMDGIMLFGKINDGEFDFQTTVKGSYFDDNRPRLNPKQTEVREYYAYYIYNDKKVGKRSEIIRVILNPIE